VSVEEVYEASSPIKPKRSRATKAEVERRRSMLHDIVAAIAFLAAALFASRGDR
jgi:hypothetical protein